MLSSMALAADDHRAAATVRPATGQDFGGWYLRRYRIQQSARQALNNALDAANTSSSQRLGFNSAGIFGLGVGYKFNPWFRGDVTGEYRGNSNFDGFDLISFPGGFGAHTYHATKSEWLALANAYVDLGTWWGVTPFVGAGAGGARVSIANFTDLTVTSAGGLPGLAFGDNVSKWNFAGALRRSYRVSPNFTVESRIISTWAWPDWRSSPPTAPTPSSTDDVQSPPRMISNGRALAARQPPVEVPCCAGADRWPIYLKTQRRRIFPRRFAALKHDFRKWISPFGTGNMPIAARRTIG
jgi:opacity protein-like surface antigen